MSVPPPRFDLHSRTGLNPTVGQSSAIEEVRRLVALAQHRTNDVLLKGEAGTGKELIGRRIHELGGRRGPFVRIEGDASAAVLDAKLFGPKVAGTSVYINEVVALPGRVQSRLSFALETRDRGTSPGHKPAFHEVRVIAGTSADLGAAVHGGSFDARLYRQLSQLLISVPALRDRREDVPLLVDDSLEALRQELHHQVQSFSPACIAMLSSRSWPGNVRELYGLVRMTVVLSPARVIEPSDLWPRIADSAEGDPWQIGYRDLRKRVLLHFETDFVVRLLELAKGNVSLAARLAKIDRKHLWRLIQRTGIRTPRPM